MMVARTRAELRAAVDELSERLSPRTQAQHAREEARIAAAEIKRMVVGEKRSAGAPEPSRTGWVVLAVGAAAAAGTLAIIARKL